MGIKLDQFHSSQWAFYMLRHKPQEATQQEA